MNQIVLRRIEQGLERKIYKESLYEFYKAAFCQLHPGEAYDENWHAKYICNILQAEIERIIEGRPREKEIIINVPPRSSKSLIASVIAPVWAWTIKPQFKVLTCSYSDTIATNISRLSKDLINSVWFQRLWGHKVQLRRDLSGAHHFGNTMGGFRYAFGMDGTVTGMGGDLIIADDPANPKKANSEVERENTIRQWKETVSNRLNQMEVGGRFIVMQRLHENDLVGHLLHPKTGQPEKFTHICIPAEYDENIVRPRELKDYYYQGKLFWPTKFSQRVLDDAKGNGALYFAGQFQQTPVPPEGNLFKKKWMEIIPANLITRNETLSPIHFFIDTAYTEDETERNDPSGILAVFKKDENVYVVNFVEVWMEFPKLIAFIKQYVMVNGWTKYSAIYIEPKASGKSVAQQLRSSTGLNVIEIDADFIKDDKVARATAVSPMVQAGKLKIVEGSWNDHYIHQLTSFPKATHDEAVDTTVYAMNHLATNAGFFFAMV
jgi:predicted phage terminase large subunit-like protein